MPASADATGHFRADTSGTRLRRLGGDSRGEGPLQLGERAEAIGASPTSKCSSPWSPGDCRSAARRQMERVDRCRWACFRSLTNGDGTLTVGKVARRSVRLPGWVPGISPSRTAGGRWARRVFDVLAASSTGTSRSTNPRKSGEDRRREELRDVHRGLRAVERDCISVEGECGTARSAPILRTNPAPTSPASAAACSECRWRSSPRKSSCSRHRQNMTANSRSSDVRCEPLSDRHCRSRPCTATTARRRRARSLADRTASSCGRRRGMRHSASSSSTNAGAMPEQGAGRSARADGPRASPERSPCRTRTREFAA